jgi:hypothetical protein
MRCSSARHSGLTKLPSATATLLLAPGRQELAHMELSTLVGQHDRCLKPQQILSAFFVVQCFRKNAHKCRHQTPVEANSARATVPAAQYPHNTLTPLQPQGTSSLRLASWRRGDLATPDGLQWLGDSLTT